MKIQITAKQYSEFLQHKTVNKLVEEYRLKIKMPIEDIECMVLACQLGLTNKQIHKYFNHSDELIKKFRMINRHPEYKTVFRHFYYHNVFNVRGLK